MRVHFSTSWIFRGWIACLIFAMCVQRKYAKPTCKPQEYLESSLSKCCSRCPPGTFVFARCTQNSDTKCQPCGSDEYQSEYTSETKCHQQKYCDEGRGFFRPKPSSLTDPEPCQCKPGYQCDSAMCELCVPVPSCIAGQGLTGEAGRKTCKECPYGYFSDKESAEACKEWTDCRALGKVMEKPGSMKSDVVCGHISGPSIQWAMVAVPCILTLAFVVIFTCYKDKLNLLSVNLRNCIQNIKRSRIQQETLMPPYHSNGLQSCPLSNLIRQDNNPPEYLIMCSNTKLLAQGASGSDLTQDQDQDQDRNRSQRQGREQEHQAVKPEPEPERDRADGSSSNSSEVSEGPSSPLSGSSCSCLFSMKEPMEVGENEDCSQLVATGMAGCCSCGQAGESAGAEVAPGDAAVSPVDAPLCDEDCCSDSGPRVSCLQGSQDLYLDYSCPVGKETVSEARGFHSDGSLYKPPCSAGAPLSVSDNQGFSLRDGVDSNNLSDPDVATELQSHFSDAALTCGQVTGNNNTTFISTGQVMNFTGDVIMVYVSQTSLGSGPGGDEPYASPVQEESAEGGVAPDTPKYPLPHCQRQPPPVQEMTSQRRPLQNYSI